MSIFDLKQSASELPSLNSGLSDLQWTQIAPSRDCTQANFPNGSQLYNFSVSGTRWWIPSKSYIRVRSALVDGAGAPVELKDDVAYNMNSFAATLDSCEFQLGGRTISRCSDYVPQVSTLEQRLLKSGAWLDTLGASLNNMEADQTVRASQVASNGGNVNREVTAIGYPRLSLGYDAANTIAIDATGAGEAGTITFAAGGQPVPDCRNVYEIGGIIKMALIPYTITSVDSDLVVTVTAPVVIVTIPAATTAFTYQAPHTRRAERRNEQETIWQPPLSIFKYPGAIPSANFSLILNPASSGSYQSRAVESAFANRTQGSGNDFQWKVTDIYFYACTVQGPSVQNLSYFIPLETTRCQTQQISAVNSLQNWSFDVSPNTTALTLAFQSAQAGSDTRYSQSKFKAPRIVGSEALYPSAELALNRYYLQYAGRTMPDPDQPADYKSNVDFMKTIYSNSQMSSGAYYSEGGAESFDDFLSRGIYAHFATPKDGSDQSTRVVASFTFQTAPVASTISVLLFDTSNQTALVEVKNGSVSSVVVA